MFLISFMSIVSATITVTLPVDAPYNLNSTLQLGGSLDPYTTYYYIVIGYDQTYYSPRSTSVFNYHSPISAESSFTTTDTYKSVTINWNNSVGATRYQILVSETSGDYTDSGGYGTSLETVGSISDGLIGYTITALSTENYVFHSIQLVNPFVGDINMSLGLLKVDFSGTASHTLEQVYTAIVDAGFSDYVSYDEATFILKGWFYSGGTDAGSLMVSQKTLVFLKGGIHNGNPNYVMRFGAWTSDIIGATYTQGCRIDILNSRYPLRGLYSGNIQIYGSIISVLDYRKNDLTENMKIGYFIGGSQLYLSGYVDEMKDSIIGFKGRGIYGDIIDLKWAQGNNWGNGKHIRLRIYDSANMPYTHTGGGKFYASKFLQSDILRNYEFNDGNVDFTNFYDSEFPNYPDGMVNSILYGNLKEVNNWQSLNYFDFHYSIIAKVLDVEGNPLENVTVSAVNNLGEPIKWIEHDGTLDRVITGNEYVTDRLTDETGTIDYYVKSYKVTLNASHTDNVTDPDKSTNTIKTNEYPFTITLAKEGYVTSSVKLNTLKEKTNILATLEKPIFEYIAISNEATEGLTIG